MTKRASAVSPTKDLGGHAPGRLTPISALFDLEDAIGTYLPDDDPYSVLIHLGTMRLGRIIERELQQILSPDGFERSEHSIMTALWFAKPPHQLSPTQLSEAVIQTTSGMSKSLNRLEKKGLVERVADPADGRAQLVTLTELGRRMVERHTHQLVLRWEQRAEGASQTQRAQLVKAIWSLLALLDPQSRM